MRAIRTTIFMTLLLALVTAGMATAAMAQFGTNDTAVRDLDEGDPTEPRATNPCRRARERPMSAHRAGRGADAYRNARDVLRRGRRGEGVADTDCNAGQRPAPG